MWLHSLKVAQLLRSAACLQKNQSRSYLNYLVLGFANSRGPSKNKCTSVGPFNGEENQNCSTARTGLRATPRGVRGGEENNEAAHVTMFLQRKEQTLKNFIFLWGGELFADFFFPQGVLKPNPSQSEK